MKKLEKDPIRTKTRLKKFLEKKQKIGIFGAGLSGCGAACLCEKLHIPYEIMDEKKGNAQKTPYFGHYGICIFSPGFSPQHAWWQEAQQSGALCINELDFAAACFTQPVIVVTGTNGKTSTVEILTQLLRNNQQASLAVGNNGTALSQAVADNLLPKRGTYICEVSSFQAFSLKFLHPVCTLWTNFAPDHLHYHKSLENYFAAKFHLLQMTRGVCICGASLKTWFEKFNSKTDRLKFAPSPEFLKKWLDAFPACFSFGQQENFALVRAFAQQFAVPEKILDATLQTFQASPHRLHCCKRTHFASFWNDSKGTNLHAVHAAMESLQYEPQLCWILGGGDKGESLSSFIELCNAYPIKILYLIGQTGQRLAQQRGHFKAHVVVAGCLKNVFQKLPKQQPFTLVLSPGFTSWDQFTSFEERGRLFEELARAHNS